MAVECILIGSNTLLSELWASVEATGHLNAEAQMRVFRCGFMHLSSILGYIDGYF